jgi:hypothetical protein
MNVNSPKRFDAEIEGTVVEVKTGLHSVRTLRASLMDLASSLVGDPNRRALLVLADPNISERRLESEWALATRTFRQEIASRMALALSVAGEIRGYPRDPDPAILERLKAVVRHESFQTTKALPRPDYPSEIFKVLVYRWLLNMGPVTTTRLCASVGCSYPTAGKALEKLEPLLRRQSNRSFELIEAFPKERWAALISRGDDVRRTIRFVDRSGQPRSPEAIAKRLSKLDRQDIAIGGVIGARHHFPDLDLLGTPRIDLTVHCPDDQLDVSFVDRLDPAFALAPDRNGPPALVLHVLQRKEPFFTPGSDGLMFADPVECLLDLHEARLEQQALELFSFLEKRRKLR